MAITPGFNAFPYPFYIKKEDAKDVIIIQKRLVAFILISMAIVVGVIQFIVSPKLLSLYTESKISIPFIVQISSYVAYGIMILFIVAATTQLTKELDYDELGEKLKKYKDGEMIKSTEIVNINKELIWLVPIFLAIAWLVCSIILPIYNLTNTLQ